MPLGAQTKSAQPSNLMIPQQILGTQQQFLQSLGLGSPERQQLLMTLVDMIAPATGASGMATGAMQPPSQVSNQPSIPSMQEMALRSANPLYGAFKGILENPMLALSAIPMMLGRQSTPAQKQFKLTARQLRNRLKLSKVKKRVFHGTPEAFPEFDPNRAGTGGGGDLYGPSPAGYWTENPEIAGGKANLHSTGQQSLDAIKKAIRDFEKLIDDFENKKLESSGGYQRGALPLIKADLEEYKQALKDFPNEMRHYDFGYASPHYRREEPNVRPAYLDIRNPFDIEGKISQSDAQKIFEKAGVDASIFDLMKEDFQSGKNVYHFLEEMYADKAKVTEILKASGYDGISHVGGSSNATHKVWIPFYKEQVIPAFAPGAPTDTRIKAGQRNR